MTIATVHTHTHTHTLKLSPLPVHYSIRPLWRVLPQHAHWPAGSKLIASQHCFVGRRRADGRLGHREVPVKCKSAVNACCQHSVFGLKKSNVSIPTQWTHGGLHTAPNPRLDSHCPLLTMHGTAWHDGPLCVQVFFWVLIWCGLLWLILNTESVCVIKLKLTY